MIMKNFCGIYIFTKRILPLVSVLLLSHCTEEPVLKELRSDQQVISDYIISHPEKFSEFGGLLQSTGLNNLLSIRGPYTVLLPDDNAMLAYYKKKEVDSYLQLDSVQQKELVYNHIIPVEIQSGDIPLGALREPNALGDYISSDLPGSEIVINKHSKIIDRDIRTANGYIHVIDNVIEPVTASVYDLIAADPAFSIFTEGINLTGLKDTLDLISFPYGTKTARTRFTVLVVPDSILILYGINSVEDLINRYTSSPDSITYLNNGFYRYMEYHCLAGTIYMSDLISKLYPILSSDNNISVIVDKEDYKLNYNRTDSTYTGFIIEKSNIPAKNGTIHTINNLLPVEEPYPTVITFESTDYFDLKQGDYYGKYYMKWFDGQNTFEKIKWEGDYLQYYYKNHNTGTLLNWDCLNMKGYFWVEITTPKIMKGKYVLTGNIWSGWLDYDVYVDGVKTASIKRSDSGTPVFGTFTWTTTAEHKFKVVAVSSGTLFWDTLVFTPTN
jgi:uncharacterized surface protein with fasciclin (FAS1) repeats